MKNTDIALKKYLISILNHEGWEYKQQEESIICSVVYKTRQWQMIFYCKQNVCSCQSIFPWRIAKNQREAILAVCNELNNAQIRGTFLVKRYIEGDYIEVKTSSIVLDEFVTVQTLKELILTQVSITLHYWGTIYEKIEKTKIDKID